MLETLVRMENITVRGDDGDKTAYGWYLTELMGRKKIRNQKALADMVTEAGQGITQSQVSKIMRGKPQATAAFGTALARALDLDEDERREHAYLLTYGQDRALPPNHKDRKELEARAQEERSPRPRYPGGAKTERDFEEGLDAEAAIRAKREAQRGENGGKPGDTSA
jgi:transcriptional regulator with XRE-family HTH domain